jgi:hypothetical protein
MNQIWFLGDSTNRGIMHSMIQQLNGSLYSAEKTHSMRFYNRLGSSASVDVGFAYYPQFWLHDQSPTLEQVLQDMINTGSEASSKSKRTVLVVGGVHWISTRHLDQILTTLTASHLKDALVIVKTLGAGFHQHIQGVHYLPLVRTRGVRPSCHSSST